MAAESASPFSASAASESVPISARTLTAVELEVIENWVQLADALGLPKSLAQIYGFIFISKKPISAQDCVDTLKVSRSSAGQGLKALRDLGAIRPSFEPGARREAFIIEPDLGLVIQGILKGRLMPAFDTFFTRLQPIGGAADTTINPFLIGRIQTLLGWHTKLGGLEKRLLR